MKIIQLLPELNEGGVERGVVELNREFVDRGHSSIVISNGGTMAKLIEEKRGQHIKFNVCSKNLLSVPQRAVKLRKILSGLKPDIIHARSRVPAWLCYFANKNLHLPFVTTAHGMNSVNAYSRVMTFGDQMICVSEVIKDYLLSNYKVDEQKLHIIQRGVDMRLFEPGSLDKGFIKDFRQTHSLNDCFVVTSVGRITYLKDYESFIKAIAILVKENVSVKGLIVGGVRVDKTEYLKGLRGLASSLGVSDKIVFAGGQTKMPEIYELSDVLVNASLKMSNVARTVTESLAMNTPVVTTTFEGLNNLVEEGKNGLIVAPQSPEDLAKKLIQLKRIPISETRSTVNPEFTLEMMVEKTLAVYRSFQ